MQSWSLWRSKWIPHWQRGEHRLWLVHVEELPALWVRPLTYFLYLSSSFNCSWWAASILCVLERIDEVQMQGLVLSKCQDPISQAGSGSVHRKVNGMST